MAKSIRTGVLMVRIPVVAEQSMGAPITRQRRRQLPKRAALTASPK